MVEAVEPFKLNPTSMAYIDKVFEHLKLLWMGVWLRTHTIIINDVSPKQNKTKQNKTKQNKTKQNKTKQNKTKQNKTKQLRKLGNILFLPRQF
jgi:hypothetical protein